MIILECRRRQWMLAWKGSLSARLLALGCHKPCRRQPRRSSRHDQTIAPRALVSQPGGSAAVHIEVVALSAERDRRRAYCAVSPRECGSGIRVRTCRGSIACQGCVYSRQRLDNGCAAADVVLQLCLSLPLPVYGYMVHQNSAIEQGHHVCCAAVDGFRLVHRN